MTTRQPPPVASRLAIDQELLNQVREEIAALDQLRRTEVGYHVAILRELLTQNGHAMWLALMLVFRERALQNTRRRER